MERTQEEFNHDDCRDMESKGSAYTDISKITDVYSDKMPLDESKSEYEPLEAISGVR